VGHDDHESGRWGIVDDPHLYEWTQRQHLFDGFGYFEEVMTFTLLG